MAKIEENRQYVTFDFPIVEKTGVYDVKRVIDGKEDTIRLLIWTDEDIQKIEAAEAISNQKK